MGLRSRVPQPYFKESLNVEHISGLRNHLSEQARAALDKDGPLIFALTSDYAIRGNDGRLVTARFAAAFMHGRFGDHVSIKMGLDMGQVKVVKIPKKGGNS